MAIKDIKISEIPEEVTEEGIKIYGPVSYETQVAILSHYLHSLDGKHDIASGKKRYEILGAIHDYIEYKKSKEKNSDWKDVDENEVVSMVAEESPRNGRIPFGYAGTRWEMCILVRMECLFSEDIFCELWRYAFWRHY